MLEKLREWWRQWLFGFTMDHGRLCVISSGTDCDGMRWCHFTFFWRQKAAQDYVDHTYKWADGPTHCEIVSGKAGRQAEAEHEPDHRDRFAERMGY